MASLSAFAQQTIKISGRVTDFNDKPISNCTVMLMDGRFNAIDSVVTDSVGFYLMNGIKPGKYMALAAIKWDEYVRFSKLPELDRRLESFNDLAQVIVQSSLAPSALTLTLVPPDN